MSNSPRVRCENCRKAGVTPPHAHHVRAYKARVYDRADEIEADSQYNNWRSLALGFALGLAFPLGEALEFANHIRHTDIRVIEE